jgi:hypothetical protein
VLITTSIWKVKLIVFPLEFTEEIWDRRFWKSTYEQYTASCLVRLREKLSAEIQFHTAKDHETSSRMSLWECHCKTCILFSFFFVLCDCCSSYFSPFCFFLMTFLLFCFFILSFYLCPHITTTTLVCIVMDGGVQGCWADGSLLPVCNVVTVVEHSGFASRRRNAAVVTESLMERGHVQRTFPQSWH